MIVPAMNIYFSRVQLAPFTSATREELLNEKSSIPTRQRIDMASAANAHNARKSECMTLSSCEACMHADTYQHTLPFDQQCPGTAAPTWVS